MPSWKPEKHTQFSLNNCVQVVRNLSSEPFYLCLLIGNLDLFLVTLMYMYCLPEFSENPALMKHFLCKTLIPGEYRYI